MQLEDTKISYETAVIAKKNNFPQACFWEAYATQDLFKNESHNYDKGDVVDLFMEESGDEGLIREFTAAICSQTVMRKYLKDKYGWIIYVRPEFWEWGVNWNVAVYKHSANSRDHVVGTGLYGDNGDFKTEEDAIEFGLIEAWWMIEGPKTNYAKAVSSGFKSVKIGDFFHCSSDTNGRKRCHSQCEACASGEHNDGYGHDGVMC